MRSAFLIILLLGYSVPLLAQERLAALDSLPKAIGSTVTTDGLLQPAEPVPVTRFVPGEINWPRFGIASGILATSIVGLHILQNNAWWANDRRSFHIYDDPIYKANFDKFGHLFAAYSTSYLFDEAFAWSGMDSAQSNLLGALCGATYELYVEIEDGYARDWGFSPGDATADLVGGAFYLLRNRVDFLRNFQYKLIYFPSYQSLHGSGDIAGQSVNPIDDYGGQSYWITADIHRMLPESAKGYWPKWLNLAFGFGGYNIGNEATSISDPTVKPQIATYLGLDFDLEKIIPESNIGFINFLRRMLSYWHLPAPAFRLHPDPTFFVLFPLKMTIK
jgi:hypothetical protein